MATKLNRSLWVSQDDIVQANKLSSQKELQHFFSPYSTRGQKRALEKTLRFEHSLEHGWNQREANDKNPKTRGHYRMLINQHGVPYTAPAGPARGKIVLFDAWQSNDELFEIYENAFEKEWIPGMKFDGVAWYTDPRHSFEEDGGHITRIDYHAGLKTMRVHWANRNYVTCYLGISPQVYDLLHNCVGKTVPGHGKHNHMLGIEFWNIIRIRGTMHGGRYPFFYNGGGPSGKGMYDISKDPKVVEQNKARARAKETTLDELSDTLDSAQRKVDAKLKEMNRNKSRQLMGNVISQLEDIFDSPEFQEQYNHDNWQSEALQNNSGAIENLMADFENAFANLGNKDSGDVGNILGKKDNFEAARLLLKEFGDIEEAPITNADLKAAGQDMVRLQKAIDEASGKTGTKTGKKYDPLEYLANQVNGPDDVWTNPTYHYEKQDDGTLKVVHDGPFDRDKKESQRLKGALKRHPINTDDAMMSPAYYDQIYSGVRRFDAKYSQDRKRPTSKAELSFQSHWGDNDGYIQKRGVQAPKSDYFQRNGAKGGKVTQSRKASHFKSGKRIDTED